MRIQSLAVMALAMAAMASAYPVTVELHNNTWRVGVEPETCTEVAPYSVATVTIRDADHLQRVLTNLEGLHTLAGWTDDAGLFLVLPGATEALAAAEAKAAEVALSGQPDAGTAAVDQAATSGGAAADANAAEAAGSGSAMAEGASAADGQPTDAAAPKPSASKRTK
jgi:hypothetical protein